MTDGTGLPGDPGRAECDRCPDGHTDPRTKPWGTRISGGGYHGVVVERSDGGHTAQADADWLWWLTRMAPFISGEHWPKTIREAEYSQAEHGVRRRVTCACGHEADLYGPAQLQAWYHAHNLWPTLDAFFLAEVLASVARCMVLRDTEDPNPSGVDS